MKRPKTKEDKALDEALDVLIAKSGHSPEAIMGDQGLLAQLTKRLVERVLGAELTHHLKTGRSPTEAVLDEQGERAEPDGNCRNGFSAKTVIGDSGKMDIDVPRDRHSSFEPLLVPKWQKKLPGFEDKIIAPLCPRHDRARHQSDARAAIPH